MTEPQNHSSTDDRAALDPDDSGTDRHRRQAGFVIAQTALLLVPLMIFAAFATDIGSWYLDGQKTQRAADAAALAGVVYLPDFSAAEIAARDVAAKNGYTDATPGDNSDFDSGPLPQIRVSNPNSESLEVEIKNEAGVFFGRLVLDSVEIERYSISEYIQPVYLGNPSSGLGTGDLTGLGLPSDQMWLANTAYCQDKEQGDQFLTGFHDGPDFGAPFNEGWHRTCGPGNGAVNATSIANVNFDDDAYVFVVEVQPGSGPVDIGIFEPGTNCGGVTPSTGDRHQSYNRIPPRLDIEIFGPSTTSAHRSFVTNNAPFAHILPGRNQCGWTNLATGLANPGVNGGFYYVKIRTRNPTLVDLDPADSFWQESGLNRFALRTTPSGTTGLCAFSVTNPTCPQVYALEWLPLYREIPSAQDAFFLAEIDEDHAGEQMIVTFFDAAENIDNIQIEDSNGDAMPFSWRYVDDSLGQMAAAPATMDYLETPWAGHTDTCDWQGLGGNPCLDTSDRDGFNDHMVQMAVDIPPGYTCGADCWWKIRYNTLAAPSDRSGWAIQLLGDPVRLVE